MNLQNGKVPISRILGFLTWESWNKMTFMCNPWPGTKNIIKEKVVASRKSKPWWILWVHASCYYFLSNNFLPMFSEAIGIVKQHMISWIIIQFTSSYVTYSSHNLFVQMFVDFGAIIKSLAIMMKVGNITYCVTFISRGYDYIHLSFVLFGLSKLDICAYM
jgi:hypothetical protein